MIPNCTVKHVERVCISQPQMQRWSLQFFSKRAGQVSAVYAELSSSLAQTCCLSGCQHLGRMIRGIRGIQDHRERWSLDSDDAAE